MATKKEVLEQSQKAIATYFQLSKYLFGEDAPEDVNEIPPENPYYESAKTISDEMGLDWDNMSHEDSIRVMLNMLADAFSAIEPDEHYDAVLTISFKKV
ncbi:hypothetical protein [Duncaniella muris]|jgi:hypothetical protein|uniref:hypothetical protein n=1 Tax=Duncaniella muris TaxID=2094150 RepID=UPI000F48D176|nr:hypothetical protein [Duncaniella muris]ROS83528.1 hypothetical protein EEK90_07775 [Muribaculaceae bacterium Isolate-036 (Harlan)]ROS93095.1 hypothetical protein EEL36_05040 [Muribaculaceae bacterium Isolate-043 (Harlan)]